MRSIRNIWKILLSFLIIYFIVYYFVTVQQKTLGKVERFDPALDDLIEPNAKIEVLGKGYSWLEGPVWVKDEGYLLFSDVPANAIYRWKEGQGIKPFLQPSGYTGLGVYSTEPGSNGLIINQEGMLVACEHGDRRISVMPLTVGGKRTLVDNYVGKRLNSPNDVIQKSNGDYYFTDPAYGLKQQENDPAREIEYFGVYRRNADGVVELIVDDLSGPNGLAFSPDEKILYVAQSDPDKAYIMSYPVLDDGKVGKGQIFFDATAMVKEGLPGLPDGLKVDRKGNVFVAAPGGILILNPQAKLLGRIETGGKISNCAWGDDGSTLYITAGTYLLRIRTKTVGIGF